VLSDVERVAIHLGHGRWMLYAREDAVADHGARDGVRPDAPQGLSRQPQLEQSDALNDDGRREGTETGPDA